MRALCTGSDELVPLRSEVRFSEEVRIIMAKFDAEDRLAEGRPVPEVLAAVITDNPETGDVLDIYAALAQEAPNPHLAIEALRKTVLSEARCVTRSNVVRERQFSERVAELARRYTNQQITAAEGDRGAGVDVEGGGGGVPRGRRSTRRWTTTSSPSTTPSPRTIRRACCRVTTCWPRSPVTSSE